MLREGTAAPDFEAQDQHGRPVSLAQHRGKWVVLYFYPADDSTGCTMEACGFRDDIGAWRDAGAVVLGVSGEGVASHSAFAAKHDLNFTLVADPTKAVCKAYGALNLLGYAKRVTYLIDTQGKVARTWRVLDPRRHSAQVLEALQELRARPA